MSALMFRTGGIVVLFVLVAAGIAQSALGQTFPALPGVGTNLRPAGQTPLIVQQVYDNPPYTSTIGVDCEGVYIGDITTTYARMRANNGSPTATDQYGPYVQFGFMRNGNNPCPVGYEEPPGVQYRWIQIVRTNDPIGGNPANQWFVDYAPGQTGNPFYSQQDVGRWGFTTASEDFPRRFIPPAPGVTIWEAVTTLACVYENHIGLIASFYWGFQLDAASGPGRMDPTNLGTPTELTVSTIQGDSNSEGWDIEVGCCCVPVPGPGSGGVLAMGVLVGLRRRR